MKFIHAFLNYLFPCRHYQTTWPIRNRQVCLDCGRERDYDLLAGKKGRWS